MNHIFHYCVCVFLVNTIHVFVNFSNSDQKCNSQKCKLIPDFFTFNFKSVSKFYFLLRCQIRPHTVLRERITHLFPYFMKLPPECYRLPLNSKRNIIFRRDFLASRSDSCRGCTNFTGQNTSLLVSTKNKNLEPKITR